MCVELTEDVLWDCEEELLGLDLLPDDAPFRVLLSAGMNEQDDYRLLRELASQIAQCVNGVSTEPEK